MKQTSHPFSTDHFLHGGDYNPDQWLDRPDILEKDLEYFEKAGINCVSLGIFSWAMLEPEEGHYQFDWMKEIIDRLDCVIHGSVSAALGRFRIDIPSNPAD